MSNGYVVANGIRIYYNEEGEGPLVLMCHGFPESSFSWRHQMAPIAEAGFRAVAIDMPGYGRSDKPDASYDVEWLTACMAGAIRGLGSHQAVLVGHDWGGALVWPFARIYPEMTAGVIGLNTADIPRFDVPPIELFRMLGSKSFRYILDFQERGTAEAKIEADLDGFLNWFFLGGTVVKKEVFTAEVMEHYAANLRPTGAITAPLEYYRNMDRNWELLEPYDDVKIEVPCLMISAAGDKVLPPELADGMETRVPNLTKVVIEDCGHWTQQEQPEVTTEHMLSYLKELPRW